MSDIKRPAFRLGWRINGSLKWGHEVVIYDPLDSDNMIWILPEDARPFSWGTEEEARKVAAASLRDLADRIEKGVL